MRWCDSALDAIDPLGAIVPSAGPARSPSPRPRAYAPSNDSNLQKKKSVVSTRAIHSQTKRDDRWVRTYFTFLGHSLPPFPRSFLRSLRRPFECMWPPFRFVALRSLSVRSFVLPSGLIGSRLPHFATLRVRVWLVSRINVRGASC